MLGSLPENSPMNEPFLIRPASLADAAAIASVLALNRDDRGLFQESAEAVAHTIEDFTVAYNGAGQITGCAGLHRDSPGFAEIYAVAVTPQCQGKVLDDNSCKSAHNALARLAFSISGWQRLSQSIFSATVSK